MKWSPGDATAASGPDTARDGETFPAYLDRPNHEWVTAARRISPRMLIEQLSSIGDQTMAFWQTVDLDALGGRVSWTGPDPAPVWLDAARDFTEYWTHHQQICDATAGPDSPTRPISGRCWIPSCGHCRTRCAA